MFTTDDMLFSVLHACENDIETGRIIYYIYMYQIAGLNFSYKYKINPCGLICKPLNSYLDSVVNIDEISIDNGVIRLTDIGRQHLDDTVLTDEELSKLVYMRSVLDQMTEQELHLICIVDIVVYDVLRNYGVDGLLSQEGRIKSTISSICKEYTDENFNFALKFIRSIKNEG